MRPLTAAQSQSRWTPGFLVNSPLLALLVQLCRAPAAQASGILRDAHTRNTAAAADGGRRLRCVGPAKCPTGWVDQTEGFAFWYECSRDCPVKGFNSHDCQCACVRKSEYVPNKWGGLDLIATGQSSLERLQDCFEELKTMQTTSRRPTSAATTVGAKSGGSGGGDSSGGGADSSYSGTYNGIGDGGARDYSFFGKGLDPKRTYPPTTPLPYSFLPDYFASTSDAPVREAAPTTSKPEVDEKFPWAIVSTIVAGIVIVVGMLSLALLRWCNSGGSQWYSKNSRVQQEPVAACVNQQAEAAYDSHTPRAAYNGHSPRSQRSSRSEKHGIHTPRSQRSSRSEKHGINHTPRSRSPSENSETSGRRWIEAQVATKGLPPSPRPSMLSTEGGSQRSSRSPSKSSHYEGDATNDNSRVLSKSSNAHEHRQSSHRLSGRSGGTVSPVSPVRASMRSNGSAHSTGGRSPRPSARSQDPAGHLRPPVMG
eukprot:TRINITY_DN41114_c0_g1_i1.p1 TRINITY_DN41114_c0_g1~~TRINITY_DN41114_c0_g1_i1.p1  ORF type:complete len:481 (+),score=21.56 TRINITY_DN41114_c0_g1_i1:53-1495(+)